MSGGAGDGDPGPEVGPELVAGLLRRQHPDLADLPLSWAAQGWDNVTFRLGPDLAVRVPRRRLAADLIGHEQRWLPLLGPTVPIATPVPIRVGAPDAAFPWRWSVVPWFRGEAATTAALDPGAVAVQLVELFRALHRPAPPAAPRNPARGIPLSGRREGVERALAELGSRVDAAAVRELWERCEAAPPWPNEPRWLHGDLHPANLVVRDGRLAAVVDWGDLGAGDPATDLAIAWTLLPPDARDAVLAGAAPGDRATWVRSRGWALAVGLAIWAGSPPGSPAAGMGERMVVAALGAGARTR